MDIERLGHALGAGGTGLVALATTGAVGSLATTITSGPGTSLGYLFYISAGLIVLGGVIGVVGKSLIAYATGKE